MEKRYFYKNISILVLIMCAIFTFNYILDPYGIWKKSFDKQVLEPNKNYRKTKYIVENPKKYDSFLFGSSKIGSIETELIPNGTYYNMTYSKGVPREWLQNINTFIDNGVEIKNVIIALDDFSFTVNPDNKLKQPMGMPYESLKSPFSLFKVYLLRNPFDLYNRETVKAAFHNYYPSSDLDMFGTGRTKTTFEEDESKFKALGDKHINDPKFNKPLLFFEEDRVDETLEEIKEIKSVCEKNNIKLYIIFNPIHKTTYLADEDIINRAKDGVSKFTDFYDFATLNEVTENNYYWAETLHYRMVVGRKIINTMFDTNY
ncbi:hypothetical protein [Clostridium algidicarnis]|uniref:hypothetical protein n=1 Tax=Clostridium algidicarnis TaxID=37659 RepID=UPI001C0BB72D|nr:hypothetical protein [Clostridium algidicarnis]MBU3228084.1 hypothetical protein [Clostridium algidicarnis]MBU3251747.1 hypothetical protein [Clostridium algidicarnis]